MGYAIYIIYTYIYYIYIHVFDYMKVNKSKIILNVYAYVKYIIYE